MILSHLNRGLQGSHPHNPFCYADGHLYLYDMDVRNSFIKDDFFSFEDLTLEGNGAK